jgi:hydrogenase-4 component E
VSYVLTELILAFVLLTNLAILGSSRLASTIQLSALQGMALGTLPLIVGNYHGFGVFRVLLLAAVIFVMKGLVFPRLLLRALRTAEVRHEVEPMVGFAASILVGITLLVASFWMASRFRLPHPELAPPLVLPVALSTILIGLFLIVSRRTALNQVVGYLVMENGIFIFGVALAQEEPFIVEMGVLLDVFVAVFVMGIAIFHISREFDHIDVDQLTSLKD